MNNKPLKLIASSVAASTTLILLFFSNTSWAETDNRETILLDDEARAFLVHEMQQNVIGIQKAITALSKDDTKGVAAALRPLGMQAMAGGVPPSLMRAVPDGFRKIGMPTHMAFDKIADAAEKGASKKEILSSIGTAMNHCVKCHDTYRIRSE